MTTVGAPAGFDPARYHLLVTDETGSTRRPASVRDTRRAALPGEQLAAILAHELGHHRDGFPLITALIWGRSCPRCRSARSPAGSGSGPARRRAAALASPLARARRRADRRADPAQPPLARLPRPPHRRLARAPERASGRPSRRAQGLRRAARPALTAMHRPRRCTRLQRLLDEHPPLASRLQRSARPTRR
jgi:Zn-dependent protease with chaperone function